MKTVGEIVRVWREAQSMKPGELGAKVGADRMGIVNLESRGEIKLIPVWLPTLSKLMGYTTVEELLALRHPPQASGKLAHAESLPTPTVELTEPKRLEWRGEMTTDEVAALPRLFRLPMPDDAMKPKAPQGRWVAFEAATTAEAGRRVLVRAADGRMYFRKYKVLETGGRWAAVPDNDAYPPLYSDADGLQIVARMRYVETPDED